MLIRQKSSKRIGRNQAGYVLLLVLFMVALVSLVIITAAPSLVMQIRRDREEELIHRGNQYAKAIRRFYKKFGRYPNSVKELLDTNHLRFLRREYKDPMTGDGKWELIHFGQAHFTPTGFFGQKLAADGALGGSNASGTSATNGRSQHFQDCNFRPGDCGAGSVLQTGMTGVAGLPEPSGGPVASSSGSTSTANQQGPIDAGNNSGSTPAGNQGGIFSIGTQTIGGGPIVGVASTSKQKSIKELNKKDHYNEWEFVYDPRMEMPFAVQALPNPGQPGQPNSAPNPNASGAPMPK